MADEKNKLYYGDNLAVLREYVADESVDLIYLDPPFNSRQDYNVLFAEKDGKQSQAQITAFKDTWRWDEEAARSFEEVLGSGGKTAETMRAFRTLIGASDMLAYLSMMAPRLLELRRVLKPSGSIYLHCDPTASHYLKLLMDGIFGVAFFHGEIIWKRQSAHADAKRYGSVHDTILFYAKGADPFWKAQYQTYDTEYVDQYYRYKDVSGRLFMSGDLGAAGLQGGGYEYEWKGVTRIWRVPFSTMTRLEEEGSIFYTRNGIPRRKRYLDESKGMPAQDVWTDIQSLRSWMRERQGYPTQKPEALLERILNASSNENDVVLDPFCGCGTTVQVAQKLNRKWIGIDITHLAISLIKTRLTGTFGAEIKQTYEVIGEPTDLAGAEQLALENKWQFQSWALGLCDARRVDSGKKGADKGIDGRGYFFDDTSQEAKQVIFSVKGGRNVSVPEVRELIGVLERERASIGVYISLSTPTGPMRMEASEAGFYKAPDGSRVPKLQLLTIKGLLEKTESLRLPPHARISTFRQAPRHRGQQAKNLALKLTGNA